METVDTYRTVIQQILSEYANIPYSQQGIQTQTVFDQQSDHYLLLLIGREGAKRVHGCLVHLDIIHGKIWIQRDGTEEGIATELLRAGIPKEQIVLGFRSPTLRKHTEFAAA
jgi:hypothetical protein